MEQLSFQLVAGLRSISPRVIALDEPGAAGFDADQGLDIRRVSNVPRGGRRSLARLAGIATLEAARTRPDVILSMHIRASYCAALTARVPLVQYVHAMELVAEPRLARYALGRAGATVAVSSYAAGLAVRYGAVPDRVHVIPPGVTPPSPRCAERAATPTFVTVARLDDAYKGHDCLIDAMPKIRASIPDVRWMVVGDGTLRDQLEARAQAVGVEAAVTFLGAVSDAERDRALDQAHVFVMPSRVAADGSGGEGFGIAYLEASARGLPVIGGRAGGAVDAVIEGSTGVLIDPDDVEALAGAVIDLLSDRDKAETLGRAGIEHAKRFSWPETVDQVEQLLESTARGRS